jgi:long-chain fatty acid transport protein
MAGSKRGLFLAFAVGLGITIPATALATNGYFSHGVSIKEKGLAGAGTAYSQDTLAAGTNPAGMVWEGNRWDVGGSWFHPERQYTATAPNAPPAFSSNTGAGGPGSTVESGTTDFFIPQFGWNKMLNDKSSIGISVFGRGGMNTDWNASDTAGGFGVYGQPGAPGGTAGVNLAQLFIMPTYGLKYSDKGSFGVSPIIAYQQFEAKGIGNFAGFSNDPAHLSDNGTDSSIGYGVSLGWQGKVAKTVALGVSYQSKIYMEEFDKYKGLFAEQGDFDIPSQWSLGLAWDVRPKSKLVFDIQQINYSDVPAVHNHSISTLLNGNCAPNPPTGPASGSSCLGGNNGAGFGWDDMTVYKIGYQWSTSQNWTWRVGYSYGQQPIDASQDSLFNILAPGVVEQHFTFGFSRKFGKSGEFNFASMYAPEKCISGPADPVNAPSGQQIENCMHQYELALAYGKQF